ncbi:MAG: aldo/keto reductase [Polyangiaceae bacterium]|nr:aldo/keto reductase [Polyangiaceae bacterium]
MNFGPHTPETDAFAIMDRAIEHGINFFDTANVYGWQKGEGLTEQIVGRFFSQGGGRRDKIVVATKVYGIMGDWPNESRLSARHIIRACEASLKRMNTEVIDLYQMHHIDRLSPWDEIWQAMEVLVGQGKVLYVGSSNFAGWHIAQACEKARSRHMLGLVSEQSLYNLIDRSIELEVIPACQAYGLGLIPWSPLKGGVLGGGGARQKASGRRASEFAQKNVQKYGDALVRYEAYCTQIGHEPSEVALAWLLANPVVTAPIVGPRTMDQLESAVRALSLTLDPSAMSELDAIFPGPGGPAPEAYAW